MKERIAEAFIELVEEKKSSKISVEAICKKAGISKPSFYKNFSDRYAVTEYIFYKEIISPINGVVYSVSKKDKLYIKEGATHIFAVLFSRKEFYGILIKEQGQNSLSEFIIKNLIERGEKYLDCFSKKFESEIDKEYYTYCFAVFFVELLKKYLNDERNIAPEKLAKYLFLEFC